jgi:putative ABC transport system permease protein
MLISWIKQFIRVSVNGKFYTIVNILGLAIGLMSAILILLWINYHLSFDTFHPEYKKIFAINKKQSLSDGNDNYSYSTPGPLSGFLSEKFPEVRNSTRVHIRNEILGIGDKAFRDYGIFFTDSSFFKVFKVDFLAGNSKECLKDINSIVLTEKLALKLFGALDVVGNSVRLNGTIDLKVTAVVKDYPKNSFVIFNCLIPFDQVLALEDYSTKSWNASFVNTYVKLNSTDKIKELENKIQFETKKLGVSVNTSFHLQPLHTLATNNPDPRGYSIITMFIMLGFSAGFVLILACINFINLITARAANRAKEVGIRKVIGSTRWQLISQYFMESFFSTILSLFVAILLVDIALPTFNQILGCDIHLSFYDFQIWFKILLIVFIVGIASGIYPAFVLSSFNPAKVLKGMLRSGAKGAGFRKTMVIIQYTLTIFLAVVTFYMVKQLNFINGANTGMSRKNVLTLQFCKDMEPNYRNFRNEMMDIPNIKYVFGVVHPPYSIGKITSDVNWSGKDTSQTYLFAHTTTDEFLADAMEIKMVEGRYFSSMYSSDSACVVINEKAIKAIDKNPILGETISVNGRKLKIIGVMKDFQFTHFSMDIKPLVIMYDPKAKGFNQVLVKSQDGFDPQTIKQMKKVFSDFYPNILFESSLLDDDFHNMFNIEKQLKSILGQFTILAILISCIGLLSLAAFIAEQQRKSLVLRKIHGASIVRIIIILLGSFTKWVIISGIIAVPLSYITIKALFSNYAFHTEYSWWIFAGAVGAALTIATVTVLYQALKTARVNPVEALRYE